jgi:hypothetical protein
LSRKKLTGGIGDHQGSETDDDIWWKQEIRQRTARCLDPHAITGLIIGATVNRADHFHGLIPINDCSTRNASSERRDAQNGDRGTK